VLQILAANEWTQRLEENSSKPTNNHEGFVQIYEKDAHFLMARRQKNYSTAEEVQLTRSYINVSQDPIVGTCQTSETFWKRKVTHFATYAPEDAPERNEKSLRCKWASIAHDVSKFVGAYAAAAAVQASGTNSDDVMSKALQLYVDGHPKGQAFGYVQCWELLRDIPKWDDLRRAGASDITVNADGDDKAIEEGQERPIGRKAAKRMKWSEPSAKKESVDASAIIASSQARRAHTMEVQTQMAFFTTPLSSLDEDSKSYFRIMRRRILRELESEDNTCSDIAII